MATTGYVLRLLGSASLESGGVVQTGPATQRHRLALLAMLAAAYPRGLTRDRLMGCLWPERDTEAARNLLKQSVHVLRRTLGERAILSAGEELRLGADAVQCDIIDFERALERRELDRAVGLHAGPFLDGFFLNEANGFEHWADEQRQRFRLGYRRALEWLAEAEADQGDWPAAVGRLRRLQADDPCNAAVTLRLMQAMDRSGDRAGAIRQARLHAALLQQELGAQPDSNVEALARSLQSAPPSVDAIIGFGNGASSVSPPNQGSETRRQTPLAGKRAATAAVVIGGLVLLAGWISAWTWSKPNDPTGRRSPLVGRLAVLPLDNLTGDPEQDYFVAGMHDALVTELGQSPDLTVISRQAVLRYGGTDQPFPQIARELNVEALVEGSVFRAGDSVRITVKLVRAASGEQIWTGTHHDAMANALILQREVARALARAVHSRLSDATGTVPSRYFPNDPVSQDRYLRGLHHLRQFEMGGLPRQASLDTLRRSITYLEEAAQREPDWAAAHARLGHAYHWLASTVPSLRSEYYPKAKAAVLRAVQLDDREAQAHASLGFIRYFFENDWSGAEQSYQRTLTLDPNAYHGSYGMYLMSAGRYEEAIGRFRQAEERDPLSRTIKRRLFDAYFCAKQYDEALTQAEHIAQIWPDLERVPILAIRGNVYSLTGRHAEAIATYSEAVAQSDSTTWALAGLAYVLARAGDSTAGSLVPLLEARGEADPILLAALGEHERAFTAFEAQVARAGLAAYHRHRCFPEFAALKNDPRVRRLIDQVSTPN